MKLIAATGLLCLLLAQQASAQNGLMINDAGHPPGAGEANRTVTMTLQMVLPAPAATASQDPTAAIAAATQSLYGVVNRQCQVLSEALKGTCKLGRLSVTSNYNERGGPFPFINRNNAVPTVSASANATFEIEVAAPASSNAAAPAKP